MLYLSIFSFYCYAHHRDLHSFPTRRSSDLRRCRTTRWWRTSRRSWQPPRVTPPFRPFSPASTRRSEEHTSELQSRPHLVCRLLLEKKKKLILYFRSCVVGYIHPVHHSERSS